MKIAIVEDEPDIARLFEVVLTDAGHSVLRVDQHDLTPIADMDVMVTDLMMPDVDGEQVLEQVTARFPHVRTVVISARYEVPVHVREMADAVLSKPVTTGQLLEAVG